MSKVTVVVPAYNEERGIAVTLENISRALKNVGMAGEIVVVDDGSTDRTAEVSKEKGATVISHRYNKGYGASLKTGIRHATEDFVLFVDGDGQHSANDIAVVLGKAEESDMVVGARVRGSHIPLYRRPAKAFLGLLANSLGGRKIPDLNSGLRVAKKEILQEFLPILPNSFSFTTTLTLAFMKSGYDIVYVPIKSQIRFGTSKINPIKDGFNFVMLILKIIVLFDPLKVFFPISLALFLGGFGFLIFSLVQGFRVPSTSVLLIISSIIIFFFGLLSDQISSLRRESKQ